MGPRIQIIGLDGCDLELLKKWVAGGDLPFFKKLLEEGVTGRLKSTVPPTTFPAWLAMFTGKNPGKLGAFDFFSLHRTADGYEMRLFNTKKLSGRFIWDIAGDLGKTFGVINIPFFSPVELNGYFIDLHMTAAYPSDILDEISSGVKSYSEFDPKIRPTSRSEIKRTRKNTSIEFDVGGYLRSGSYDEEVFIQVFNILDSTAHCASYENVLKESYIYMDKKLAEYFDFHSINTFIVSDHGMKKVSHRFYMNKWLSDNRFLKYNDVYISKKIL